MRLIDLEPKFWAAPGRRGQGLVFRCPHCFAKPGATYLCIAFANPLDGKPAWDIGTPLHRPISRLWAVLYGDVEAPAEPGSLRPGALLPVGSLCVPPGHLWTRSGESFADLSLHPSVDASGAGCWHGWVTNGEVG